MKKLAMFATAALLISQPVWAAANPWFGTWTLNRDKSSLTGSTITVRQTGNVYHFDLGAIKYDVVEDGQDHPVMPERTTALTKKGENEWVQVNKIKGVETSRTEMTLSPDGKTLTRDVTGTHADGSTYQAQYVETRLDDSKGLAGTWKDTKDESSATEIMVYSDGGAGTIQMTFPASKATMLVTLDGKPVVESGPRAMQGETVTFQQVSPTELHYAVQMKGKPFVEGTETVSEDGKLMKDVNWLVTKPTEKTTEVFDKQ